MGSSPFRFRFPAEWEPHKATWLAWPHEETFGYEYRDGKEPIWIRLVEALQDHEEVHILVQDQNREARSRGLLKDHGVGTRNVFFHHIETDDFWIRDNGPLFVTGSDSQAVVNWRFNAWGGTYEKWERDNAVPSEIATLLKQEVFSPPVVLEGGAVDFNGKGTCLTTESVLLNPNRNPGLSRHEAEQYLGEFLGVTHTIWLPGGDFVDDPDTDGHVDLLARFINENTAIFKLDPSCPDYKVRLENFKRLREATDQDGRPLNVVILPGGSPNFYISNRKVLVPTIINNNAKDEVAIEILKGFFPDRKIVGIDCTKIIENGGAIHCVTMQQPAI